MFVIIYLLLFQIYVFTYVYFSDIIQKFFLSRTPKFLGSDPLGVRVPQVGNHWLSALDC